MCYVWMIRWIEDDFSYVWMPVPNQCLKWVRYVCNLSENKRSYIIPQGRYIIGYVIGKTPRSNSGRGQRSYVISYVIGKRTKEVM